MPGFRLTEAEAWDFIEQAHTSYVTTLRRDGRPITIPVWHAVLDGAVYIRTPSGSSKLKRIRHDPRAFFLVDAGEQWAELVAVNFEARAAIVDDAALAERALAAMQAKYAAFEPPPEQLPEAVKRYYADRAVISLTPAGRVSSWNNAALISG